MKVSTSSNAWNKTQRKSNISYENSSLESLIAKYEPKLLYNTVIESKKIKLGYKKNNIRMLQIMRYQELLKNELASIQPLPITLKYLSDDKESTEVEECSEEKNEPASEKLIQFPYSFNKSKHVINEYEMVNKEEIINDENDKIKNEILQRNKLHKNTHDWMTAYDNFENDLVDEVKRNDEINYGTPDPKSEISNVPCGGCGALLHCKVYHTAYFVDVKQFSIFVESVT